MQKNTGGENRMMKILKVAFAALALFAFAGVAHAEGDAAKGKKVFNKCKACHKIGEKAKNGVGPILNGIIGRKAGTREKFKYSKLMKGASELGLVWDEAMLDKYLDKKGMNKTLKAFITEKGGKPKGKSKMAFAGLKKAEQRADVIAYLKTFADK
jgi:cytochrome c